MVEELRRCRSLSFCCETVDSLPRCELLEKFRYEKEMWLWLRSSEFKSYLANVLLQITSLERHSVQLNLARNIGKTQGNHKCSDVWGSYLMWAGCSPLTTKTERPSRAVSFRHRCPQQLTKQLRPGFPAYGQAGTRSSGDTSPLGLTASCNE